MPGDSYIAHIDEPEDSAPVFCDSCDWGGTYQEAMNIKETHLTPGDPSPAGRCPSCGALVYVLAKEPH